MAIQRLAYAELWVDDLGAATAFERDIFGLTELAREDGRVAYSCDPGGSCDLIVLAGRTGVAAFAFGVDSDEDLDRYAARLASEGVACERRDDPAPGFASGLAFTLPGGHTMLLVTAGDERTYRHPTAARRGVGPADADHITIGVEDSAQIQATVALLRRALDFRVSDIIESEPGNWLGAWTRAGECHHDLGLMRCGPGETLHHMAFELDGMGHITAAADRLGAARVPLETGPGRHGVGGNLYAYFWAPGGNRYELSAEMPRVAGARDVPNVRVASSFNAFSAWGIPRPDTFRRGSGTSATGPRTSSSRCPGRSTR